ncbi:hypothetical protein LOTGIDRAFT_163477 [Lottia gigantea]|uniref:Uncharacterized protein n=1 Tax=Lottia gigantea TaxID=225164 RepID=V4A2Q3_LOTGI|nr:hypothetical protein LOTGIDRAFT_163477 [Lottia gigantea]ESO90967.1 hypothetical protein LOTGIDRAFT_163477 [Lottia gigantea]
MSETAELIKLMREQLGLQECQLVQQQLQHKEDLELQQRQLVQQQQQHEKDMEELMRLVQLKAATARNEENPSSPHHHPMEILDVDLAPQAQSQTKPKTVPYVPENILRDSVCDAKV